MPNSSLDKIAEEVKACKLCPLHKSRKNAVPGEGSIKAKLILIGEAPGVEEDEQGRPFVGRAGEILNDALKVANLKRKDLFITSVVKCRPPDNRIPNLEERKACNPYLKRQIDVIKPKVICLLGNIALQTFFKKASISKLRGKAIERDGHLYFCTYHPAAILYNASLKSIIYKDMRRIKELIENLDMA
ncbi:MAG: uracil-DNA glycosylase [archaeon]|nr:uracil-DNA glycosylase [archaeon]